MTDGQNEAGMRQYIDTPNLSGDAYKDIRTALKTAGVRYDPEKKGWYMTTGADREQIGKIMEQIGKIPKDHVETGKSYYKGFAYAKGQEKPEILYGENKDEILNKLKEWNKSRPEDSLYEACSIGQLDGVENKYTDYHRFSLDGKDISPVYLKLPPMTKEEFMQVTGDLKANGARYNPGKKQWYIPHDADMEKFAEFLPDSGEHAEPEEESLQEYLKRMEQRTADEKARRFKETGYEGLKHDRAELPDYRFEGVQYNVSVGDRMLHIPADRVGFLNQGDNKGEFAIDKFMNRLEDEILSEYAKMEMEGDSVETEAESAGQEPSGDYNIPVSESVGQEMPEYYNISVSKSAEDNRCTIWFKDGRDPLDLHGGNFNLHFPSMEAEDVHAFVKEYMEKSETFTENRQTVFEPGDQIDCYVPQYEEWNRESREHPQNRRVFGIENISGKVTGKFPEAGGDVYAVENTDGKTAYIRSSEIYTEEQTAVLFRAGEDRLNTEQFDMVADNSLSSAQMEEIRFGFRDGLEPSEVAFYAKKEFEPWQMDLSRYGMQHGVGRQQIQDVIGSGNAQDWIEKRNEMDRIINANRKNMQAEFQKQGYHLNPGMIKKIETLKHLSKTSCPLSSIAAEYRRMKASPEQYRDRMHDLVKDIGRELELQEKARMAAQAAQIPQA